MITMTNQLEEELRAITATITQIKKQRKEATDPHYISYLNRKLDKLQYEKQVLLKKLGITGDLL